MKKIFFTSCGLSLQSFQWDGLKTHLAGLGVDPKDATNFRVLQEKSLGPKVAEYVHDMDKQGRLREIFDPAWLRDFDRKRLSAEIAILQMLLDTKLLSSHDTILLVMDEEEQWIGEILSLIIREFMTFGNSKPQIDVLPIAGLSVREADRYVAALEDLRKQLQGAGRAGLPVMCLCGGFKGTIAAMLLYAFNMHLNDCHVRAFYAHEDSPALIELPVHPFRAFEVAHRRNVKYGEGRDLLDKDRA